MRETALQNTKNKTGIPGPEEVRELEKENPVLLHALLEGKPAARAWYSYWKRAKEQPDSREAREQAAFFQAGITRILAGDENAWCGYPTDMTRCSPFFPVNSRENTSRDYLENFVISSTNWGTITYTGPKLSTYEEDVLIALLAMLDSSSQTRYLSEQDGRTTYTYKGAVLPLLKLLGYKRPGSKDYDRLIQALRRMTVAAVEFSISTGKSVSGQKRDPRVNQMAAILSSVLWEDTEKNQLIVTINPFFYENYIRGSVTMLNISTRIKIRGSIAKAMYRFVQSHKKDLVFTGHFSLLSEALNMDDSQPLWKTRQLLKTAIRELILRKILTEQSGFLSQDVVKLERTSLTFPPQKKRTVPEEIGV